MSANTKIEWADHTFNPWIGCTKVGRAQQGGALARRIPAGICKPLATEGDWELLERYGEAELRNRHHFGVLDRLENTRMANDMPDCDRSACRDHSLSACDNPDCPSLRPNAKVSGADTASAGLPGYTAGDNTE